MAKTPDYLMLVAAGLLVSSCAQQPRATPLKTLPVISRGAPDERQKATDAAAEKKEAARGETEYFGGTTGLYQLQSDGPAVQKNTAGDYRISFTNADIVTVADAVLKDLMGTPYIMDPNVRGTVSLETAGSVNKQAVFDAFEAALSLRSVAIVPVDGVYQIVPTDKAPQFMTRFRGVRPDSAGLPGFSVQIVPLNFASPIEIRKVLEPFAPRGGILRVDEERRLMILGGTGRELQSMRDIIATFDLDWTEGMNFALYDLKFVDSEVLAKEVLKIMGDADSPITGAVRLVPIPRINKLLGISARKNYLEQVEGWIARLDVGERAPGRRIYVYQVKNGRAADLAQGLSQILGTGRQEMTGDTRERSSQSAPSGSTSGPRGETRQTPDQARDAKQPGTGNNTNSGFEANGMRVVPNENNNSILIYADNSEYAVIENALIQMDTPPRQVMIEAVLAEVTLTNELRYGVQWSAMLGGGNAVTLAGNGSGNPASVFPGFSYAYTGASDFKGVLNALEGVTDVNVISSPKLMAVNNQPATLQVGDEVPVPSATAVSVTTSDAPIVNNITYKNTGVILTVTPRINDSGIVMLDITQEVSDVAQTTSSGIDAPTIQQRKITSTVVARDGQSIALGGLIRESQSVTRTGVPILSRIPLLGNAFRSNTLDTRRTELIILITPHVIRSTQEADEVMGYLQDMFKNVLPPREVEPAQEPTKNPDQEPTRDPDQE